MAQCKSQNMTFEDFYSLYPRKQAGAGGRIMWGRLTDDEKRLALEAIPRHVAMWKAEGRDNHLIPLPATWLNPKKGRRWEDEIDMPEPKAMADTWWASEQGILAKASSMGIPSRPGESFFDLKNRINEAIKRSA